MWGVAYERTQLAEIRRRVLEPFCCDNQEILAGSVIAINVKSILTKKFQEDENLDKNDSQISAFVGDSIFRRNEKTDTNELKYQKGYIKFGRDYQGAIKMEVSKRVAGARQERLSRKEKATYSESWNNIRTSFVYALVEMNQLVCHPR